MAETKTSDALTKATTKTEDYGLYTQGKIKLNYDNSTNMWKQEYQATKKPKMFIPPMPNYKAADTTTTTTTDATTATTDANVKVATPMVQQRNNDTRQERLNQENQDRFGPGQNPMQTADRIVSMFTPGTETYDYYETKGALKVNGNTLTVNFDAIDEKGGYGLQQSKLGKVVQPLGLLGRAMKFAEKGMMEGTVRNFIEAGIITSDNNIEDTNGILPGGFEGTYNFTLDKVKYDNYITNAPIVSKTLTDNKELQDKLGKLDRVEQDKFISVMAISMAKDDDTKNAILNALQKRSNGATSAVIAAYTGEYLDLDKTNFFGDFYSDTFKAQYNSTLAELNAAKGNNSTSSTDTSVTSNVNREEQRNQPESMKNTFNTKVEKAKKDPKRLNQASAYSGAGDRAEPTYNEKGEKEDKLPSDYGGTYQKNTSIKTPPPKDNDKEPANNSSSTNTSYGGRVAAYNKAK